MNIAIFSPSQNPYSETFIQAHKNYLKGQVFYYYGSKGRIKLEGQDRLVSKATEWRYRIIRKINKHPHGYINEQSVLSSLKAHAVNVVLVEYGTHAHNLLSILKTSGLPVVVHFHGFDASVYETIKKCNNYQDVIKLASKVVVVSTTMQQKLIELGFNKDDIAHTPCAADPIFETVKPSFGKKQFIGIGRFTDKKAPYYTIMAFKEVVSEHPNARLLLAGDGVLHNMCKNLVKQYGLEYRVQFLGVISPDEYKMLLSESLAFVQHSITAENGDMEGTPVAIMEASVAGLPIISTNHAGIPDVIVHGKTGLLCDEHDVTAMANNMIQVLDDVAYAQEMGNDGKHHILENFSMQRHIQVLQEVLAEAIKVN
ncbi:MAG: glycosyltransferase [Gelidibacter sp.]